MWICLFEILSLELYYVYLVNEKVTKMSTTRSFLLNPLYNISDISPLLKMCMLNVLAEISKSLGVMMIVLRAPIVASKEERKIPETLEEKLNTIEKDDYVLNCDGDDFELLLNRYQAKLKIKQIKEIIVCGFYGIFDHNTLEVLAKEVESLETLKNDENNVFQIQKENKTSMDILRSIILAERRDGLEEIQNATYEIGNLKDKIQVNITNIIISFIRFLCFVMLLICKTNLICILKILILNTYSVHSLLLSLSAS